MICQKTKVGEVLAPSNQAPWADALQPRRSLFGGVTVNVSSMRPNIRAAVRGRGSDLCELRRSGGGEEREFVRRHQPPPEIPHFTVEIAMDDGSTEIVRKSARAMSGIVLGSLRLRVEEVTSIGIHNGHYVCFPTSAYRSEAACISIVNSEQPQSAAATSACRGREEVRHGTSSGA